MRVFISYRREDSAGHAGRLYDALQARFGGENVFMDRTGIASGQDFVQAIDSAVRSCDALIAMIGDTWLTCAGATGRRLDDPDDFVRMEIASALQSGIPVVPVLVEGASMPAVAALPEALKPLARLQAHELSDSRWAYDTGRLTDAIEKLVGARAGSGVNLVGEWRADVTYDWGATHAESFAFKVDGDAVFGTASFLGAKRAVLDGTLNGNKVQFHTKTQEVQGDWNNSRSVVHQYRGTISGDLIKFYMHSEGGSSIEPVEFTARRASK